MTDFDQAPDNSPLSQSVVRDGKTVEVAIYGDGEGGWLLEVVDQYGNSTVWDESFESDGDALDAALHAIEKEGIDSFIGLPSDRQGTKASDDVLSDAEFYELGTFLTRDEIIDTAMDATMLDGFFTAIAIGPRIVLPSEWLPCVWDWQDTAVGPKFEDEVQANRIMSLVMRHYNEVVHAFNSDPASFKPRFWRSDRWGASAWCKGFITGFVFNVTAWTSLVVAHSAWLAPFMHLGTDEGIGRIESDNDAEKWIDEIEPSVLKIHAFCKHKEVITQVRDGPKVGRNDPCPCGSGKKFKKCCGADRTQP